MKKHLFSAVTLTAASLIMPHLSYAAEGLSYRFLELEYVVLDVDIYEKSHSLKNLVKNVDDGDGFRIGASYAFADRFFIFGNYSDTEADFTFSTDTSLLIPADNDIKTLQVGVGYYFPITFNMDFIARAAYTDIDLGNFNLGATSQDITDSDITIGDAWDDLNEDSSDGFLVDVGVRAQTLNWLELGGGVRYTDLDSGDDFSIFANALFEITPNMGINLSAHIGDNLSSYSLGFRYSLN